MGHSGSGEWNRHSPGFLCRAILKDNVIEHPKNRQKNAQKNMKKDIEGAAGGNPKGTDRQNSQENTGTHEINTEFMREEIRQRPLNKKKLFRRTMITAFLAALFGAIACVAFLLLEPVINNAINPSEEVAAVTFPEETAEEEMSPEDMIASDEEIQQAEVEKKAASLVDTDAIAAQVQSQVEKDLAEQKSKEETESAITNYQEIYASLSELADQAAKGIVTVTVTTPDSDWAGDVYNNTGSCSGLIVAEHGSDILILAGRGDYNEAQEIQVAFHDGEQVKAKVLTQDTVTGMTILKVSESELSGKLGENEEIAIALFGSSVKSELLGKPVIAIGSPSGTAGSVSYGIVTNADLSMNIADTRLRQITTDISGSTQGSGVLVDLSGNVVGWIDMQYRSSSTQNLICATGVTELKGLIEKMSNEIRVGYLGIHGTDVPESVQKEQEIPAGAYILQVEMDSPAMDAGLQSGDVVISAGGAEITSCQDLADRLMESRSGRDLALTVMRQGADGYHAVNLTAQLQARMVFGKSQ